MHHSRDSFFASLTRGRLGMLTLVILGLGLLVGGVLAFGVLRAPADAGNNDTRVVGPR
jgi:hypothetical protein